MKTLRICKYGSLAGDELLRHVGAVLEKGTTLTSGHEGKSAP